MCTVVVLAGGRARTVQARLEFVEYAKPFSAVARTEATSTLADGPLEPDQVLRFSLPMPADALPPVRTDVGELRWDLVIQVDRPLLPDIVEREPLA